MSVEQTVVDRAQFKASLQPSDAFASLVKEIGGEAGLGSFALGAIQALVDQRTSTPVVEDAPAATAAG